MIGLFWAPYNVVHIIDVHWPHRECNVEWVWVARFHGRQRTNRRCPMARAQGAMRIIDATDSYKTTII